MQVLCFRALCAGAALLSCVAAAQDFSTATITGTLFAVDPAAPGDPTSGGSLKISFTCNRTPTCTGTYTAVLHKNGCTNALGLNGGATWIGLDLSRPGPISGTFTLGNSNFDAHADANGVCTLTIQPGDTTLSYTGSWDGAQGSVQMSAPDNKGGLIQVTGTFKSDVTAPPPVFPMTVSANIDTQATASAQIQLRTQDAGTPQNVYVFAMAPISQVKDAVIDKAAPMQWLMRKSGKDLPVQCVLAQLASSGQLVGVSASTLQSFINGVSGSQAIAVTIMNGVPTVNIAGATFFVGYGSTGPSMINGGINRAAVTVPGAQVCSPTAPQTGWWWNPAEDGRGFSVEKHGNNFFFASFLYDVSGRSTWYVSSGPASLEGSLYVGDLLSASGGQTLGGDYRGFPNLTKVGTATITFNSATNGTLIWPGGTVPIQRQAFVPNGLSLAPMANGIESGWWWNDQEAGRGFFLEFQGDWLDVAGYMYDDKGNSVWYLTVAEMSGTNQQSFSGNWWSFANGQTLTGSWKPNTRTSDHVAPVTITFTGTDTAFMTLPGGRTTALKRQRF